MQPILHAHGSLGSEFDWPAPKLVAISDKLSRPGYSSVKANEFRDKESVLKQKLRILAKLIKKSSNCVVYTGAGISRASGIADYATKAKKSIAESQNHSLNRLNAIPSQAHHILTAMQNKNYIHHWLQQNHDGLAQKSGFPMSKINQIHGSWFDKKNPVVMMDDTLNKNNYKLLEEWEDKVDLCLAIGTSLSGMRSDGIAKEALKKERLVIINLQQTPYDQHCSLRFYGNLQTIMEMLAKELALKVDNKTCITNPYQWNK